jgi:hypothetical protein
MNVEVGDGADYETRQAGSKTRPADNNTDDIYNFLAGKGAITGNIVSPPDFEQRMG